MVEIGSSEMPEPEQDRLFVWDLPLRLFHWGLAAAVVTNVGSKAHFGAKLASTHCKLCASQAGGAGSSSHLAESIFPKIMTKILWSEYSEILRPIILFSRIIPEESHKIPLS